MTTSYRRIRIVRVSIFKGVIYMHTYTECCGDIMKNVNPLTAHNVKLLFMRNIF